MRNPTNAFSTELAQIQLELPVPHCPVSEKAEQQEDENRVIVIDMCSDDDHSDAQGVLIIQL